MMWLLLALESQAATHRFALLAGANHGGEGRAVLRYAVSDAEEVASVLQELGGLAADDTFLLEEPSPQDLSEAFSALHRRIEQAQAQGDRSEVIVYYSGHSDTQGLLLAEGRYPYATLRQELDALPSDLRVLVLDSCSSGAMVRTKGGTSLPPFLVDEAVDVSGYAYLTSAAADEFAQEADPIGGSYFTHFFVTGLRGAADTSADGRVTLSEAYDFAYAETLSRTETSSGGAQHATYDMQLNGTGELVLTDLAATESTLSFASGLEGRLFIRDEQGELVAELYKPRDRPIALGLPAGTYRVLLEQGGRVWQTELELTLGGVAELDTSDFEPAPVELAQARGGQAVTRVPLSIGVLPTLRRGGSDDYAVHNVDLSLGVTKVDAVRGAQLSLLAGFVDHELRGLQGGVGGVFTQDGAGAQLAVGPTWASGSMRGFQGSATLAYANQLQGAQAAVVATGHRIDGPQLGVVTLADHAGAALGVVNVQRESPFQLGVANLNQAARVQVGLVNVGPGARVQVGLINLSDDAEASVGLVSVNRGGYNHVRVGGGWVDLASVGVTYGGSRLFTLAEVGWRPGRTTYGLGLGWHQPLGERLYVDLDGSALYALSGLGVPMEPEGGLLVRGQALVGVRPNAGRIALFAGPQVLWMPLSWADYQHTTGLGGGLSQGGLGVGASAGVRF